MKFNEPLTEAVLVKRYKRFLTDVTLENGEEITVHCPNTGSMKNCQYPGKRVWISDSGNPKRKYRFTWEIAEVGNGALAGINTHRANALVKEALQDDVIKELSGYDEIKSEVKYGAENSRIDFLLTSASRPDCYVEVKSVTLGPDDGDDSGLGYFPDAVSTRGQKHVRELMEVKQQGARAVLLFCVQHSGIRSVSPADHIDEEYGKLLREAVKQGVEVMAWRAHIDPGEVRLAEKIETIL